MAYIYYGASITSFGSIAIVSSFNLPTTSIEVTLPRRVVGLASVLLMLILFDRKCPKKQVIIN